MIPTQSTTTPPLNAGSSSSWQATAAQGEEDPGYGDTQSGGRRQKACRVAQTEPAPTATARGAPPTSIVATTRRVRGSRAGQRSSDRVHDPQGSAARRHAAWTTDHADGRKNPLAVGVHRHHPVAYAVGDPDETSRYFDRDRCEVELHRGLDSAGSVSSRRQSRRSRASPRNQSEPSPMAISRNWTREFSTLAGDWKGKKTSASLRNLPLSVLSRWANGQPATHRTPSPDAIAHGEQIDTSSRIPVAAS